MRSAVALLLSGRRRASSEPVTERVYQATFARPEGGGSVTIESKRWNAVGGSTGTRYAFNSTASCIRSSAGKGATIAINAGEPEGSNTAFGLMVIGGLSGKNFFVWTDEAPDVTFDANTSINTGLYVGARSTIFTYHATFKIGGVVYVSNAGYTQQALVDFESQFAANAEPAAFSLNAATRSNFRVLDFIEGTKLGRLPDTVTVPYGIVTEKGYYIEATTTTTLPIRLDSPYIDVVSYPTPSLAVNGTPILNLVGSMQSSMTTETTITWEVASHKDLAAAITVRFKITENGIASTMDITMNAAGNRLYFQTQHNRANEAYPITCEIIAYTDCGYLTGGTPTLTATTQASPPSSAFSSASYETLVSYETEIFNL